MGAFSTEVAVRWSDMDVYGHVNNARVVTLLEEARIELLFGEAVRRGARTLADGVIVVDLAVRYRAPLVFSAKPVRVTLWVSELRGASFTLEYAVSATVGNAIAVTASTTLAPYDPAARKPRRLTSDEQTFLASWRTGEAPQEALPEEAALDAAASDPAASDPAASDPAASDGAASDGAGRSGGGHA